MDMRKGGCALIWLLAAGCAGLRADDRVAGEYVCVAMGSRPCDTSTELQVTSNGNWRWGRYNGTYAIRGNVMTFDGAGGLASWGPAEIGNGSITFTSGSAKVVWKKPTSAAAAGLAPGIYYCRTAPGGCQTSKGIEIGADGSWSWGASGGSYSIAGGKLIFSGPQLSGWGPADLVGGKLVFHSGGGDSEWAAGSSGGRASADAGSPAPEPRPSPARNDSASVPRMPAVDPNTFERGCPLQPFDRQRVEASIQDARAPGASSRMKEIAHDQLAEMCRKAGDTGRAEKESAKAEYWRRGGR